jgi:chromate transporter
VVLPLLEDAVVNSGWVSSESFFAGYGAAQAIPGPLFAFSAYLGALATVGQPALLGAVTALLFMFLPGFLLVAGVLPFWQAVAHSALANSAIAGVNAAPLRSMIRFSLPQFRVPLMC